MKKEGFIHGLEIIFLVGVIFIVALSFIVTWEISKDLKILEERISKINFNPQITVTPPAVVIEPMRKFWNETELDRLRRECSIACMQYDTYIPVIHTYGCVCCNEGEIYSTCLYITLEK